MKTKIEIALGWIILLSPIVTAASAFIYFIGIKTFLILLGYLSSFVLIAAFMLFGLFLITKNRI